MLVEVTQEDINLGCRAVAENCPVARALMRATGIIHVYVCRAFLGVYSCKGDMFTEDFGKRCLKKWDTPERVAKIISAYDATGFMNPFSFELD